MNKYWFRKRRGLLTKDVGWGWMPISWEGWVVVASFLLVTAIAAVKFSTLNEGRPSVWQGFAFLGFLLFLILFIALISRAKTPK